MKPQTRIEALGKLIDQIVDLTIQRPIITQDGVQVCTDDDLDVVYLRDELLRIAFRLQRNLA